MRNVRRAFSLIELLVVVAILSILLAVLFPVLGRAKQEANKATAMSNIRQLSVASALYSGDYDDMFAVYFAGYDSQTHSYGDPLRYWTQQVSNYISPVEGHGASGQALADDLPKVFFDPGEPFKSQIGNSYQFGVISSWGVSDDLVQWYGPTGISPTKLPCSTTEVANPSQCIHLTETYDWLLNQGFPGNDIALSIFDSGGLGAVISINGIYSATYQKSSMNQSADPRARNVTAFCDGHAKAVTVSELLNSPKEWSRSGTGQWP
ncbi:MAG TPA: type II secretion system protein [Fimbriimonadaceae bacterium]|jgi:prepilin-type N-terminal cleavage/methylation domain-containing protein